MQKRLFVHPSKSRFQDICLDALETWKLNATKWQPTTFSDKPLICTRLQPPHSSPIHPTTSRIDVQRCRAHGDGPSMAVDASSHRHGARMGPRGHGPASRRSTAQAREPPSPSAPTRVSPMRETCENHGALSWNRQGEQCHTPKHKPCIYARKRWCKHSPDTQARCGVPVLGVGPSMSSDIQAGDMSKWRHLCQVHAVTLTAWRRTTLSNLH